MFLAHYGFDEQPFGSTPNPKYLYPSRCHREALASLFYGIETNCGFLSLIAKPGMGKTMLLFHLLERLRDTSRTVYLFQTQCNSREFLRYLMADIGCDCIDGDMVTLHSRLNNILLKEAQDGRRFILIVDESQNLDDSVLETIRLLSDFETPSRKLMQIILAGQPQLEKKLAKPDLAQLRQRISVMSRLAPLSPTEVKQYIECRLGVAGYSGEALFAPGAIALIARHSEGIPRTINNLCFNALTLGYAGGKKRIDGSIVREAISDLDLRRPARFSDPVRKSIYAGSIVVGAALAFSSVSIAPSPARGVAPKIQAVAEPVIKAAAGQTTASSSSEHKNVTIMVKKGDTLGHVAERYLGRKINKQTIEQIMKLNPQLKNADKILTGERLNLPASIAR
jgi:general secretion pathway protein A